MAECLDKSAPIICADCSSVEIHGEYLYCAEKKKTIYNAKPNWCPYPTWIKKEDYEQLSLFKE